MKEYKIGFSIGYIYDGYEWIEAENKREARKLWKMSHPDKEDKIVSVEERVDILKLLDTACENISNAIRNTKHLEIDDFRGDDKEWFVIPVWYCWLDKDLNRELVREFHFSRDSYESESEMVERFNKELNEFVTENKWKRIDK